MGYSSQQAKDFVNAIGPIISKYAKEYGYQVASPIIAQAICESGVTSTLAVRYHNYFGLKAGSQKKGSLGVWDGTVVNMSTKEEYTPGTLTSIKDFFRVYKSMDEGVRGYFEFLTYSRYANLKSAKTYTEFLTRIKNDGYCTSSTYVNTCSNIVKKYDLTKYDWQTTATLDRATIDRIAQEVIDDKWGNGNVRRQRLEAAGYDYRTIQNRVNELLK